jgi:hypothetical protein
MARPAAAARLRRAAPSLPSLPWAEHSIA